MAAQAISQLSCKGSGQYERSAGSQRYQQLGMAGGLLWVRRRCDRNLFFLQSFDQLYQRLPER
jgi:hypothetical protein